MKPWLAWLLAICAAAPAAASEAWFDRVERALTFSACEDRLRARLTGVLSLEGYAVDTPPPGLVFADGERLFNPRLMLLLQGQWGGRVTGFVQARLDRGFDPGNGPLELRLDEYALLFIPWADRKINVQVGQFATVVGTWVARHDSWDNPFVNAPLPYENLTGINDSAAPATPHPLLEIEPDERYEYNPVIWGPSYASGAAVSGRWGRWEAAAEVKNAGLSSRPESWSVHRRNFSRPAFGARVGFRPDLRWNVGVSAAESAYFLTAAGPTLPAGRSWRDYRETVFGADAGFAWRHLQIWAEVFRARFEVPVFGAVRTTAGYVETKYRFSPQVYGAWRWNRQTFSALALPGLGRRPWGADRNRIDTAVGYRFGPHVELKFQVSAERAAGEPAGTAWHAASQLNVRF